MLKTLPDFIRTVSTQNFYGGNKGQGAKNHLGGSDEFTGQTAMRCND
jgi:hypothetical protein